MTALLETHDLSTGKRRFYVDGKRASFGRFYAVKEGAHRVDTFRTINMGGKVWHRCEARQMTDQERLAKMRLDWGQGRDWTADPREGLREIKRLERKIASEARP